MVLAETEGSNGRATGLGSHKLCPSFPGLAVRTYFNAVLSSLSPNPFSESSEEIALPAPEEASCLGKGRPEKLPSDLIVCVLGHLPRLRHFGWGCGRALF